MYHFKLLHDEFKYVYGSKVYRIQAIITFKDTENNIVNCGDRGGWVGGYNNVAQNLAPNNKSWVMDESIVFGRVIISNSLIKNNSILFNYHYTGNLVISGSIIDNSKLCRCCEAIYNIEIKNSIIITNRFVCTTRNTINKNYLILDRLNNGIRLYDNNTIISSHDINSSDYENYKYINYIENESPVSYRICPEFRDANLIEAPLDYENFTLYKEIPTEYTVSDAKLLEYKKIFNDNFLEMVLDIGCKYFNRAVFNESGILDSRYTSIDFSTEKRYLGMTLTDCGRLLNEEDGDWDCDSEFEIIPKSEKIVIDGEDFLKRIFKMFYIRLEFVEELKIGEVYTKHFNNCNYAYVSSDVVIPIQKKIDETLYSDTDSIFSEETFIELLFTVINKIDYGNFCKK